MVHMRWVVMVLLWLWAGASLAGARPEDPPDFAAVHVVKKGETLSQIARRHKTTVEQLKEWNQLKGDRILIGQRLTLHPGDVGGSSPLAGMFAAWRDSVVDRSRRERCYALVVNKVQRQMEVYLAGEWVSRFPVAIGEADAREMADRRQADDHHLKEGVFHLSQVAWDDQIPRWDCIWMRLHTVEWAKKDYAELYGKAGIRRLTAWEAEHGPIQTDGAVRAFNRAYPGQPLWRGLGIHGGGTKSDWTYGCIALDRDDVLWLFNRLRKMPNGGVGTPVAVVRF